MKAMMKIYTTFFLITMIAAFSAVGRPGNGNNGNGNNGNGNNNNGGGGTYTSVIDGFWNSGETWGYDDDDDALGNELTANTDVIISNGTEVFTESNYNITLNSTGNNGGTITVKGKLVINGDLSVDGMDWTINVEEGGIFIVNGSITLGTVNNGSHTHQTSLTINGDVHVDGDFSGYGDVDGAGNLYVEGDLSDGIDTDDFEGVIAEDIPASEIPAPVMGPGSVIRIETNHRMFFLEWEFDTENKYTIDNQVYEFAGFRIVRNLEGNNHSEQILRGYFIYNDDSFEGFDYSVLTNSYTDLITEEDIEGIEDQNNIVPEYYIRAVYVKSVDGDKNHLERSDYILSPNSELMPANNPLPIELLHFSVKAEGQSVNIQWSTAAEINNDFFTIERSTDGNNWEIVSFVYGAGNSNYVINYEYTDKLPLEGISYYRLKQTDFDGQFEYFSPAAVYFSHKEANTRIVHVRSKSNNIHIQYTNEIPGASLVVADIRGRILGNFNVQAADVVQDVSIDLPGNYTGEMVIVRLVASGSSDQRKLTVR